MLIFTVSLFLATVFSFAQFNQIGVVWGVQPNLVFALLVVYMVFEKDWLRRLTLILWSAFLLNFQPIFGLYTLFYILVFLLIPALTDYLRWQPALNTVIIALTLTFVLNIFPLQVDALFLEWILNLIWIGLLSILFHLLSSKKRISNA